MISAFPKIFALGTDYIRDILKDEIEVTEKIDGSQFCFGKVNGGELFLRSKGKQIFVDNPEKMFSNAVDYVMSIYDQIPHGLIFFCEYLRAPRHNILAYERVPKNHLILFGASKWPEQKFLPDYHKYADSLGIESVPILDICMVEKAEDLFKFLEADSILGKEKIEGFVVKNYNRPFLLGGQPIPLMMGKFVSERFKEVHDKTWGKSHTSKGKWEVFKDGFRTEARWQKAVQHLRDGGELENDPRDIGKLIKEIQHDIEEEEKENIKAFLWQQFGKEVLRKSIAGFPEWYKEQLVTNLSASTAPDARHGGQHERD